MPFEVRWFDRTRGMTERVTLEAASAAEVAALAAERGAVVLDVREVRHRPSRQKAPPVSLFCTEVSTLLGAGLNIVEALEALARRSKSGGRDGAVTDLYSPLLARLRGGQSFSAAVQSMEAFPAVFRAAVQATDRAANIREGLDRYVAFDSAMSELRTKLVSAAVYPAVVVSFGVVVVLFLLGYVVPRFASVYTELPTQASVSTRWILGAGQALAAYRIELAVAAIAVCALTYLAWSRGALLAAALRAVGAVPQLRRTWNDYELARFYRAFGLLLAGGFPVVRALEESERGFSDLADRAKLRDATLAIRAGARVADSLRTAGLADEMEERLLSAGERSATLATIAQTIADIRQRRFGTAVERLTRIAEPVLLMVVGSSIGLIVLLMYLPIIDLATSVR